MRRLDGVVFDVEILHAVPQLGADREPDITYCKGWEDHAGMGVACVCAVDLLTGRHRVFLEDNLAAFVALCHERAHVLGFNSLGFDDKVMQAAGYAVTTTYDVLVEARAVADKPRAKGRRLDDFAKANLGHGKSAPMGAVAPVLWQRGQRGAVIDYCMEDVRLTAGLVLRVPRLIDPVTGRELAMRRLEDTRQYELGESRGA